jgi:hypothetical protein
VRGVADDIGGALLALGSFWHSPSMPWGWGYSAYHYGHVGDGQVEYSKGQRFKSCDECSGYSVRYTYTVL